MAEKQTEKNEQQSRVLFSWRPSPGLVKAWRIIRPVLTFAIGVCVAYSAFSYGLRYVMNKYINPVDINDPSPITVIVNESDSASRIASKLYNACGDGKSGVIANTAVFKVYVDFVGKANKLKAGTYILSKNMDIPQIVDIICAGNPPKATTSFKVIEGYTAKGILGALTQAKLNIDESEFLALCNNKAAYSKYAFVSDLDSKKLKDREFALEGYLFPDTYIVYVDAKPDDIINKMLVRFNEIFTDEYILRAQELDMSIDEIIILASVIEREAALASDFPKVSAVFYNRIAKGQKLESCATLQYVLKVNKYQYSEAERATDSPYNTYIYPGLPTGPICNPGKQAIEAALYPDSEYIEKEYLYFCNMDIPENKALIFARTYEQHQKNVEKYQQYWK